MIYTVAIKETYDYYISTQLECRKGVGGSVWKTRDEAEGHCTDRLAVYGVEADWEKDTQETGTSGDDWHKLTRDAVIVKLDTEPVDMVEGRHDRAGVSVPSDRSPGPPTLVQLQTDILVNAIRKHRDQKGDDRCWQDDEELYSVLPEGYVRPVRQVEVELVMCKKYRVSPGTGVRICVIAEED